MILVTEEWKKNEMRIEQHTHTHIYIWNVQEKWKNNNDYNTENKKNERN